MKKLATNSFLFPNGMVATTDQNGEQIPELQGEYSIDLHLKIIKRSSKEAILHGFPELKNDTNDYE
jgi:hypothetical protein